MPKNEHGIPVARVEPSRNQTCFDTAPGILLIIRAWVLAQAVFSKTFLIPGDESEI
jgi:hypothetical protein